MNSLVLKLREAVGGFLEDIATEMTIKNIMSQVASQCEIKRLTKEQKLLIQAYWQPLVHKPVDTRLHQAMLSLTGLFKPEFEPFDICHEVQKKTMTPRAMSFFDDKNLYRCLLTGFNIPIRVAECRNGVYYLPDRGGQNSLMKNLLRNWVM